MDKESKKIKVGVGILMPFTTFRAKLVDCVNEISWKLALHSVQGEISWVICGLLSPEKYKMGKSIFDISRNVYLVSPDF